MAGMKKMKILGLLLVFILSIGLVSGCSQAEMGFVNLMNEVNSMDAYEGSETVNLKINKLPSDLTKSDPVTVAAVQSMLSTYSLRSDVRMDAGREVFDGTIYLVNNDTGAETQVFSFVAAGGTVYLKVDDLLSFAKLLNNQQLNKQLALLDGVQYISISSAEVEEAMSASGQPGYDVFNIKKQQALYRKMMDGPYSRSIRRL
jgi:ABC-type Na+ efflux pump permease subunit